MRRAAAACGREQVDAFAVVHRGLAAGADARPLAISRHTASSSASTPSPVTPEIR